MSEGICLVVFVRGGGGCPDTTKSTSANYISVLDRFSCSWFSLVLMFAFFFVSTTDWFLTISNPIRLGGRGGGGGGERPG